MKKKRRVVLPLLFWLAVWQIAASAVGKELLLPQPLAVGQHFLALYATWDFWLTTWSSLGRIFLGLLSGVVLGTVLAGLTSAFSWADALLSPAIRMIRATPVASFIILVLLWVETGRVPGVIAALMVLPVVWGNVSRGIAETDVQLLELMRAYRLGRWKTLRLVYLPSALPYFASGCRTAMGLAWKAGVAAEVLCLPKHAIGTQVYYSKIYLETPSLFAWTLVVILLSFLLEWVVGRLLDHLEGRGKAL